MRRAGVEGTGSYGASLTRYLLAQGVDVFDVNWMDRADRRRRGKSDPLDAQNAARAVLSGRACARAKSGDGPVQIARMYKLTKASAVKARTQTINQLKAVIVTADPALREELAGLGNAELFRICARFTDATSHEGAGEESVLQATRITLGVLASRIGQLSEEIREVDARLARLVEGRQNRLLASSQSNADTYVQFWVIGWEGVYGVGDSPVTRRGAAGDPAGPLDMTPERSPIRSGLCPAPLLQGCRDTWWSPRPSPGSGWRGPQRRGLLLDLRDARNSRRLFCAEGLQPLTPLRLARLSDNKTY